MVALLLMAPGVMASLPEEPAEGPRTAACTPVPPRILGGEVVLLPMDCAQHGAGVSRDVSGLGNDAAFVGAPELQAAVFGEGYHFGADRFLRIASRPSLDIESDFTVAFWMWPERLSTSWAGVVASHATGSGSGRCAAPPGAQWGAPGWHVQYRNDGVHFSVNSPHDLRSTRAPNAFFSAGKWTHVAARATETATGIELAIYLDGELRAVRAIGGWDLGFLNKDCEMQVGTHHHGGSEPHRGAMDDLRLYDRGLSEEEIRTLAQRPGPEQRMLWALNGAFPFYWGPVAMDNGDGPPQTGPVDMQAIEDRRVATGEYPAWYHSLPARFECCATVVLDRDTLRVDDDEFRFALGDELDRVLPDGVGRTLAGPLQELGHLVATWDGLRFQDAPYLEPALDGQAAVTAHTEVTLEVDSVLLPGNPRAKSTAQGKLFLDETTGTLELVGMDSLFMQAALEGPSYRRTAAFAYDASVEVAKLPKLRLVSVDLQAEMAADTDVDAMLGAGVEPGSLAPRFVAGGVGVDATAEGEVRGNASALGVGSVSLIHLRDLHAGAAATVALRGELMVPTHGGLPPGGTLRSPYTGVAYQDLQGPVALLLVGPVELEVEPVHARWFLGADAWWAPRGELTIPPPPARHTAWSGAAIALGEARVSAPEGFGVVPLLGASVASPASAAAPASAQELGPADAALGPLTWDLAVQVEGDAGSEVDVTFERPIAALTRDGTWSVDLWRHTVPAVGIGSEGWAKLHIDARAVQSVVHTLASQPDRGFDAAVAEANAALDANGDGVADLATGAAPHDPRALTRLTAEVVGPDGGPRVFAGEQVLLRASARGLLDEAPIAGVAAFHLDGARFAEAALGPEGDGEVMAFWPVMDTGDTVVEVRFEGTATHRAATTWAVSEVGVRPPGLDVTAPEGFEAVDPAAPLSVRFEAPAVDPKSLLATSAEVRVDDGPWLPAARDGDAFVAAVDLGGLHDDFHEVSVRLANTLGLRGERTGPFVIDRAPPDLRVDTPHLIVDGEPLTVRWNASEPVLASLNVTHEDEGWHVTMQADGFAWEGALTIEGLPAGVYRYEVVAVDSAGHVVASRTGVVLPDHDSLDEVTLWHPLVVAPRPAAT